MIIGRRGRNLGTEVEVLEYSGSIVIDADGTSGYSTIQAALDANPTANFLFLVYPGIYANDTINFTANYQHVIGMGSPLNTVVTSADATICNGTNYGVCVIRNLALTVGAPTTAIPSIVVNNGVIIFENCLLTMSVAASIATIVQPSIVRITGVGAGAGEVNIRENSIVCYNNDGVEATANKVPFIIDDEGYIRCDDSQTDVNNTNLTSVTAMATFGGDGELECFNCDIDIDDVIADYVVGTGYVVANIVHQTFKNCKINVSRTDNSVADVSAFYTSGGVAASVESFRNDIIVTAHATSNAYSYYQAGTPTIIAYNDNIISAADGIFGTVEQHSVIIGDDLVNNGNFNLSGYRIGATTDIITGVNIDGQADEIQTYQATANTTYTMSNPVFDRTILFKITDDGGGAWTATFPATFTVISGVYDPTIGVDNWVYIHCIDAATPEYLVTINPV